MQPLSPMLFAAHLWMIGIAGVAAADASIVQWSDGTARTITHLGDTVGIYSDAHGNTGPLINPNGTGPSTGAPHGDTSSGHLTPFGTPTPPNNLTPPPVLPPQPNRPLMPQQPAAPAPSAPPSNFWSPSGSGRFGR